MSKKTNKTVISGQATIKNPRTTLYGRITDGITDVINLELTEPQTPTRLSDIKLRGLKSIIGKVNTSDVDIDAEAIAKTLKNNADKVKVFVENHGNWFLSHTKTYQTPKVEIKKGKVVWVNEGDFKEVKQFFKPDTKTYTYTADDVEKQQKRYAEAKANNEPNAEMYKPSKVGEGWTIKGVKITDYEGLLEAIKKTVPQCNRRSIYDPNQDPNADFGQLDPVLLEFSKLAREVGIEPSGNLVFRETKNIKTRARQVSYGGKYTKPSNDPDIITTDIRESDRLVYRYVLYAIVRAKEQADQALKNKREVVNIKDAKNHDVIMQPHTMSLTDMIDGAFEGREAKRLFNDWKPNGYKRSVYGSPDKIKKAGGWLAHIDTMQSELPIEFDETDRKTLVKFMTQTKALVIDVTTALGRFLRDNPDHDPNDYISLTQLAKYIGRFNDSKLNKGELRPAYRQQILNGLQMAQLISADYVVGKDKKGNKEWRKVYLIDRITDYKTYGNTDIVTGVKVDFTKEYKESVGLNLGVILDGVLLLNTPEHKALGAYILERFAQHQEATVRGEPQKITADTLIKKGGIIDDNKTHKLLTLQKALDTFVENGLIAKWACKNGAKNITGYDRESQTILFYPTENLKNSYAPKSQTQAERKAIELVQKNRLTALKKWFKGYMSRETASNVLGISVAELNEMLAGTKVISDDIVDKISEEL